MSFEEFEKMEKIEQVKLLNNLLDSGYVNLNIIAFEYFKIDYRFFDKYLEANNLEYCVYLRQMIIKDENMENNMELLKRIEAIEKRLAILEQNKSLFIKLDDNSIIQKIDSKHTTQKTFRIAKSIDKELKDLTAVGGLFEREKMQDLLNTILILGLEELKNQIK